MSKQISLNNELDKLIHSELKKRQADIIIERFGLSGKKKRTLSELGKKYGITRERIRQVEALALTVLGRSIKKNQELIDAHKNLINYIEKVGKTIRIDSLAGNSKHILRNDNVSGEYVSLLFKIFGSPLISRRMANFYPLWYMSKEDIELNKKFVTKLIKELDKKKASVINKGDFYNIFVNVVKATSISDSVALNFINNSKAFSVNLFGDFGLSKWSEVFPKTIKDKSYLILKRHKKPLHFREIAEKIAEAKFDNKNAHIQTVHNELIKDVRFVLVGRGLYSLREFNIEPGTTREVLQKILKKNGPLKSDKIINLASQQRVVKDNTITMNLQNKKYFKKLEDGRYHLA